MMRCGLVYDIVVHNGAGVLHLCTDISRYSPHGEQYTPSLSGYATIHDSGRHNCIRAIFVEH